MDAPISPIVQGLTTAFQLANVIHQQRAQDRALALQERQIQDREAEQQSLQERQDTDLSMRLHAMGARGMTPSDELEAQTGTRVKLGGVTREQSPDQGDTGNSVQGYAADGLANLPESQTRIGKPTFEKSDIKSRLVKAGGKQWVMPSQEEQDQRANSDSKRESDAAVAKASALEKVKNQGAMDLEAQKDAKYGMTVTKEVEDLTGGAYKEGTRIAGNPQAQFEYHRAIADAIIAKNKKKDITHSFVMSGAKGQGVATVDGTGKVAWQDLTKFTGVKGSTEAKPLNALQLEKQRKEAEKELVGHSVNAYFQHYQGNVANAQKAILQDADKPDADPFVKAHAKEISDGLAKGQPKTKDDLNSILQQLNPSGDAPKNAPAATPATAPAAPRRKAYNKKTGVTMEWDGKAWVKAKAE